MKLDTVLNIVQTVAIIVLLALVWSLGKDLNRLKVLEHDRRNAHTEPTNPDSADVQYTGAGLDESQLRQIIREELASVAIESSQPVLQTTQPDAQSVQRSTQQLEEVDGAISYFVSVGSISEIQMSNLQASIAQLDEENRKLMLKKLMTALNTGLIDGRL